MNKFFGDLSKEEVGLFKRLNTPQKIQDFLETVPMNFEKGGDTLFSPRKVLEKNRAHCFEGALFAAAVFWHHGREPLLLDLESEDYDDSHVVALFQENTGWGAISKTNHAVLRFRDPIYKNPRELAMSYFHEYFLNDGEKTLRSYAVFDLRGIKENWLTDENDLWYLDKAMDREKHTQIVFGKTIGKLRKADPVERKVGKITIWKK